MSGEGDTPLLDVQLLANQNTRTLPDTTGYQPYEQGIELASPTLPTTDEIQTYVHAEFTSFNKRRRNDYTNKKKWEKRRLLQAALDHTPLENESTTQHEKSVIPAQSLMVMECDTQDADTRKRDQDLIFDGGCTAHVWNHRDHFTSFVPYTNSHLKAACANGTVLDIMGKADIGPLKNVLYVPGLRHCLISGTALLKQGHGMYIGTVPNKGHQGI